MKQVVNRSDTQALLHGLRQYAPDATLAFDSLSKVFARQLPWYARMWCAALIGRTATDPVGAVAFLGGSLTDPEFRIRAAAIGALARVGGDGALTLLRGVAQDRHERGNLRRAAARGLGGRRHA